MYPVELSGERYIFLMLVPKVYPQVSMRLKMVIKETLN